MDYLSEAGSQNYKVFWQAINLLGLCRHLDSHAKSHLLLTLDSPEATLLCNMASAGDIRRLQTVYRI